MANQTLAEFTEKLFVTDADHTFIWDTANSISKRVSRNSWLNSGTLTSDAPVTISQTWNGTGSTVFKALVVNATTPGTTSSSSSLLLDLQVGTVSQFSVAKNGAIRSLPSDQNGLAIGGIVPQNIGFVNGPLYFGYTVVSNAHAYLDHLTFSLRSNTVFGFSSGQPGLSAIDTALVRDGAANTLALRNGAAAQTFNVYGTSSASNANYARLALTCGLDGNATISTQALGTGVAGTVSINGVPVGLGKGNVVTNVAVGTSALNGVTTGSQNTVIGYESSIALTSGNGNTSIGFRSLRASTGSQNVSIGADSLQQNSSGSNNTSVGCTALNPNTTGGSNSAIGYDSGRFISGGVTPNTITNNSVYIGALTKANASSETNQIVIGYDATGIGSNSVVLGNDSITKTALKGNVGIGTTSPTSKLHVAGELGTNLTTFDSGAAVKITNTTATGKSWLLTSGIVNIHNEFFCIRQESVSQPALIIAPTTNNVGVGINSPPSKLTVASGDIEVSTAASGLILKSPDGTRYRITVPNGGASLTITAV